MGIEPGLGMNKPNGDSELAGVQTVLAVVLGDSVSLAFQPALAGSHPSPPPPGEMPCSSCRLPSIIVTSPQWASVIHSSAYFTQTSICAQSIWPGAHVIGGSAISSQ